MKNQPSKETPSTITIEHHQNRLKQVEFICFQWGCLAVFITLLITALAILFLHDCYLEKERKKNLLEAGRAEYYWDKNLDKQWREIPHICFQPACDKGHLLDAIMVMLENPTNTMEHYGYKIKLIERPKNDNILLWHNFGIQYNKNNLAPTNY